MREFGRETKTLRDHFNSHRSTSADVQSILDRAVAINRVMRRNPLTTSEFIEWGNPAEKPAYDYMKQYSPYDNVKPQNYPTMLVKVSYNDSQVPYWEGTKFVAKIRTMKTDKNPLRLKVNFGAGHGGSSGRYDALNETAFNYAFLLWQVGITE